MAAICATRGRISLGRLVALGVLSSAASAAAFDNADRIGVDIEWALRRYSGVELPQAPGRGVARIGEGRLAGFLLARASDRKKEIAVRLAMGARRATDLPTDRAQAASQTRVIPPSTSVDASAR